MEKESITAKETEEEIARLKRLARKTHDVKLRRRYDMIRLFLSKRAKPEIAAILFFTDHILLFDINFLFAG